MQVLKISLKVHIVVPGSTEEAGGKLKHVFFPSYFIFLEILKL